MNRDIICCLRITIDSLPKSIRNSKFLFLLAKKIFNLPKQLFTFREDYKKGKIKNLDIFYSSESELNLNRASKNTDINSFHISLIERNIPKYQSLSIIDIGCGTGYLLQSLEKKLNSCKLIGIDFNAPINKSIYSNSNKNHLKYISGDITNLMKGMKNNSFNIVICTHVIEHLSNPYEIINELRRIAKNKLIVICPLEKEYKWGMNYHVSFFPTNNSFINFLTTNKSPNSKFYTHKRLGDSMYIEDI